MARAHAHTRTYIHARARTYKVLSIHRAEQTRYHTAHQAALLTIIQFRLFKMILNNGFVFLSEFIIYKN